MKKNRETAIDLTKKWKWLFERKFAYSFLQHAFDFTKICKVLLTVEGFVLGIRAYIITWLILTLLLFYNDVMELLRQSINSYILWCTFTRVRYLLFPTLRFYLVELGPYFGVRLSLVSNQAKCLMIASSLF